MKRYLFLLLVPLVILVSIGIYRFALHRHSARVTKEITFLVDQEFEQVRKIMVRTDAAERLVACYGATITDQNIRSLEIKLSRAGYNGDVPFIQGIRLYRIP